MKSYLICENGIEINRIVSDDVDFIRDYCNSNGYSFKELSEVMSDSPSTSKNEFDFAPLIAKFIGKYIVLSNGDDLWKMQNEINEFSQLLQRSPISNSSSELSPGDVIELNGVYSICLPDGRRMLIPNQVNGNPLLPSVFDCLVAVSSGQIWQSDMLKGPIRITTDAIIEFETIDKLMYEQL